MQPCLKGRRLSRLAEGGGMGQTIDDSALDTLFREARTYTTWQPRPVAEVRSDVPIVLTQLLDRLLAKDPDSRFATPAEARTLLALKGKDQVNL